MSLRRSRHESAGLEPISPVCALPGAPARTWGPWWHCPGRRLARLASGQLSNGTPTVSNPFLLIARSVPRRSSYHDDVVRVRMAGSCDGCAMSTETLQLGVERLITHYVPSVKRVEAVENTPLDLASNTAFEKLEASLGSRV